MSGFRVVPLGVGDAFSARHYSTCLALGAGDAWLLVDCPHPVRKMLREASAAAGLSLDLGDVAGVALSHLHADHASGMEDFMFFNRYALGRRARLLAVEAVADGLWAGLLAGCLDPGRDDPGRPVAPPRLDEFLEWTPLETGRAVEIGPFSVECRFTKHMIPTTAFRISALGRTLGFSADTPFDPDLIDWLASADLIVHEATHLPSPFHTPYDRLAALPAELRGRLRLIHCPDEFDAAASGIEVLRQGRVYAV